MYADIAAFLIWWMVLLALSALFYPLTSRLFASFEDRGWLFGRVLGLACCGWVVFALCSFTSLPFTDWVCRAALIAVPALIVLILRLFPRRADPISKTFVSAAVLEELAFGGALAFWTFLRGLNPDLRDLEKFMDHGFVASMLHSTSLPAPDMWFAGGTVNYYYFGHYLTAFICRAAGIGSAVGYNLAMASTFALCLCLSFSLVYNLVRLNGGSRTRSAMGGLFASLLTSVGGNGHAFVYTKLVPLLHRIGLADAPDSYWYPDATRYINCYEGSTDNTIHEFPYYSFIVSDLHAHVLDICFVLLFLALCLAMITRARALAEETSSPFASLGNPPFWAMGCLLGIMAMTNYWDLAIYLVVSLFFSVWACALFSPPTRPGFWVGIGLRMVLLFGLSRLISLPFDLHFTGMGTSVALVKQSSPLHQWLILWYLPLLFCIGYALYLLPGIGRGKPALPIGRAMFCRRLAGINTAELFAAVLFICGFGLIIGPELVYIKDIYGGAPRANTMFKLTYQAFLQFGLAMGFVMASALPSAKRLKKPLSCVVRCLPALCLFIPLCYTPIALTSTYWGRSYQGLNGLEFIREESRDEWELIDFLQQNAAEGDRLLEAPGSSYTQNCRVSMATGIPTLVGWHTHEWLWRNDYAETERRFSLADEVYETHSPARASIILEEFGIDWIVITPREKERYPDLQYDLLIDLAAETYDFGTCLLLKL